MGPQGLIKIYPGAPGVKKHWNFDFRFFHKKQMENSTVHLFFKKGVWGVRSSPQQGISLFWDPGVVKIGFLAKKYSDFTRFHNFVDRFLKNPIFGPEVSTIIEISIF